MAKAQPVPIEKLQNDYSQESWTWDVDSKPEAVVLSSNSKAAYFHTDPVEESTGTAGVRGSRGFTHGEHFWEVMFLEPPRGTSVMVGVGTKDAKLHTENYNFVNLLGRDEQSWGLSYKGTTWHKGQARQYCEPFYKESTVISMYLNMYRGTLTYYKDGQCLGVAFQDPRLSSEVLHPIISSTATNSELEVQRMTCRYWSLQGKCTHVIVSQMAKKEDIPCLPLPTMMKNDLHEVM